MPRWLRRTATVVAALTTALGIVAGIGTYAFLSSTQGVEYMLKGIAERTGGAMTFEDATGSLLDAVRVRRVAWRGATAKLVAQDVSLSWSPAALWSRGVVISAVGARAVELEIEPTAGDLPLPTTLALPVDIAIDRLGIGRLEWRIGPRTGALADLQLRYAGGGSGHRVSGIVLEGSTWRLEGEAAVAGAAPFAVRGSFTLAGSGEYAGATSQFTLGGSLEALALEAAGKTNGTRFSARAALAPLAAVPLRSLQLDLDALDLHAWSDNLPATSLAVALRAEPAANGMAGSVSATNSLEGVLDGGRLPLRKLTARFAWSDTLLVLDDLDAQLAGTGRARGQARVPLGPAAGQGRWTLAVTDVDLRALQSSLVVTRLTGAVDAELAPERQTIRAKLADRTMVGGLAVDLAAVVAAGSIEVERLAASAGPGSLEARGSFALSGERRFTARGTSRRLDLARIGSFPAGALDARFDVSGVAPANGRWQAEIDLAVTADSRLAGLPVAGTAHARASPDQLDDVAANLTVGAARLALSGSVGVGGGKLAADFDLPRVQELRPLAPEGALREVAGALRGRAEWQGPREAGALSLRANGTAFAVGKDVSARVLDVEFAIGGIDVNGINASADAGRRTVRIITRGEGIVSPQGAFDAAQLSVDGTLADHRIALELVAEGAGLAASAQGGLALRTVPRGTQRSPPVGPPPEGGWQWSGMLNQLQGRGPLALHLLAPMNVGVGPSQVRLGTARFAMTEGTLQLAGFSWDAGRITTRGSFATVPLATLARLAGAPLPLASTLTVGGDWDVAAAPRLNGTLGLRRDGGDLFLDANGSSTAGSRHPMGVTALELSARLVDDRLSARATLAAGDAASASAEAVVEPAANAAPGRIGPESRLALTGNVDLPTLKLLRPWVGTSAVVNGRVRAEFSGGGTLAQPTLSATLAADSVGIDAPQYGVNLKDGRLRARIGERRLTLDEFVLAGGAGEFRASGDAALSANGAASTAQVTWRATRFRLLNRPDLRLIVDGGGTLALQKGKIALNGGLKVLEGNIAYAADPTATLGRDVVVKGRSKPTTAALQASDLPLVVDLTIDLGNRLQFSGEGLDTRLDGVVRVTTGPRGFLGKGTIQAINGTYRAFGQRLTIDPGRLVFDGPLDNPGLDIVALRKNLAVEAGVQVTGTVRVPIVQLTSNPPVNDSEKLAWLVLGHGLDRTSGTDLSALQAASALLTGKDGKPITTMVAETVGVDDIAFKTTTTPGSQPGGSDLQSGVVAIGKRLSDQVSIIYEQGLTAASSALRIEYALTRDLRLSASTGLVSGIGIQYRKSFD